MGQKISQTKNSLDISVYLSKYYPNYTTLKVLNNGMLSKTVMLLNEGDKCPLVAKIFFKSDFENEEYKSQVEKIKETQKKIVKGTLHDVLPLIYMEENTRSGIIFRQYIEYNLKERIYLMPYLNNIQKIWITLQILYAANELVDLGIVHGDLKPENILLTSNLSVYLSDIATYKPAYISMDDIGNYTYFFGTNKSDSLKGCYFAPERLLDKGETSGNDKTNAMDVFSIGVIIAELFLEKNIFDFPQLLNYKKKNKKFFDIEEILVKIPENIRNLIKDMIKIDPKERITIKDALDRFSNEICPVTMTGFLLHFNTIINSTVFWKPDLIIGFIYRYWIPLWKMIFGPDDTPAVLYQHLNLAIINKIILENPLIQNFFSGIFIKKEDSEYIFLKNYKFFFDPDSGIINEKGINELREKYDKNNNKDCVYILINFLLQNMQYTKYDSTNLVALEMVKNLSFKLNDITKLKLIVPYFVENLKRESYTTKLVSLNFLFEVLYSFNYKELILPVTEYNYFDSYIFPAILEVYKLENHELILEFFNNIDKIIDLQQKFLNLTLKARLFKINHSDNQSTKNLNTVNESGTPNQYEDNTFEKEKLRIKKDRRDEIFKDYDTSIEEFKSSLFRFINDIIGEINDIDITISVIRKLPDLFLFYGKSKTNDFSKFIINNFNKTDWIIQKEILCYIPKMMTTLGENALNDYILPCMESLIENNSNELKTYELIKSFHQLFKMEYLSPKDSVELFVKLLPFLIHPNLNIKNEIINFTESLISYISPEETISYLYQPLSKYIKIPPISLTEGLISNYSIDRLNRIAYQLEFRKKNSNNNNVINDKNKNKQNESLENKLESEYKNQFELFKELMERQKKGNIMANDNGEVNYSYEGSKNLDPSTYLDRYPKHSLKEPIEKYIKKEFSILSDESEKRALLQKIVYKIFYLSDSTENYNFPYIKDNRNCSFKIGNNILNSELFNIYYILKTLSLSIKSINVNELLHPVNNSRTITNLPGVHILANYMCNKSFHNWRPQGQIITTLYDHDKNQVEKLLPLPENKFCSFDNKGCVNIFKITQKENDDSILVKKIWYSGIEIQCHIKYRNTITMLDNLLFLAASENKIYTYNPLYTKETKQIFNMFCESYDNSNITCVKTFGNNSLESQKIIMGTEKGGINIYDQRIKKIAISNKIPISYGMINCISETFSNNFYIGTIGGHLLEYDMRLNSIVNDFNYCENLPILGILPYKLTKNCNYDLSSINKSNNYYVIWTGTYDHEIGLWNSSNMHCDLLLKVNTLENRKELRPLTVEIPYLNSENNTSSNKEIINKTKKIKKKLNSIIKFTHRYDNNFTKSLLLSNLGDKLNEESYDIFSNMTNIYDNPSTVQCVISPYCDSYFSPNNNKNIEYDNCSYLLSAGNDMTIRYWDITREGINNSEKKSYLVNAPNNLTYCNFTKSNFDKINILQSNEAFNEPGQRSDMPGFSPYLNYNGVSLHYIPQNEFEGDISNLKFCSRIADSSHRSIITDLLPLSIEGGKDQLNVLASCSWDGKIKIWK